MPSRKSLTAGHNVLQLLIGLRLRQIESGTGSQEEFLKKTGLSRATYFDLRGMRSNARIETLQLLADNLGMSIWELFGLDDKLVATAIRKHGLNYKQIEAHAEASRRIRTDATQFDGMPEALARGRAKAKPAPKTKPRAK